MIDLPVQTVKENRTLTSNNKSMERNEAEGLFSSARLKQMQLSQLEGKAYIQNKEDRGV